MSADNETKVELLSDDVGPLIKRVAQDLIDQRDETRRGQDRFTASVASIPQVPCLLEPRRGYFVLRTMAPLPHGIGVLSCHGEDEAECLHKIKGELGHALYELGLCESLEAAADVAIGVSFTAHRIIT
jgi:hypothetical protein